MPLLIGTSFSFQELKRRPRGGGALDSCSNGLDWLVFDTCKCEHATFNPAKAFLLNIEAHQWSYAAGQIAVVPGPLPCVW